VAYDGHTFCSCVGDPLGKAELSVGWVDPRVGLGWVGLGWVGNRTKICVFSGLGRVMGLKWQMCEKYITDTRSRLLAEKVESVELIRWWLRAGFI